MLDQNDKNYQDGIAAAKQGGIYDTDQCDAWKCGYMTEVFREGMKKIARIMPFTDDRGLK